MQCPHCAEQHPAGFYFCPREGRAISGWTEMVGRTYVDRYRLIRLMDTGGRGALFEGEELQGAARVAIKIIHPEFARGDEGIERFLREAAAAGALDHPSLPRGVATGRDEGGAPYVVRRHESGQSLAKRIAEKGPLSAVGALQMGEQILGALAVAHSKGVTHRAITPSRIFLADDRAVLFDWGAANLTAAAEGAPYRAPEQSPSAPGDARSDQYSLALTLYEAMTGRGPTSDNGAIRPGSQTLQSLLEIHVASALDKALEKDATRRFASAADLGKALAAARAAVTPEKADIGTAVTTPAGALAAQGAQATQEAPARGTARRRRESGAAAGSNGSGTPAAAFSQPGGEISPSGAKATAAPLPAGPGQDPSDTIRVSAPPPGVLAAQPADLDIAALEARASQLSGLLDVQGAPEERARSVTPSPSRARVASSAPAPARKKVVTSEEELPAARSTLPWVIGGGVVLAVAAVLVLVLGRGGDETEEPAASLFSRIHVAIRTQPAGATIELDGARVQNPYSAPHDVSKAAHEIRVAAAGHLPEKRQITFERDVDLEIALRPAAEAAPPVAAAPPAPAAPTPAAPTPPAPGAATVSSPAAPIAPGAVAAAGGEQPPEAPTPGAGRERQAAPQPPEGQQPPTKTPAQIAAEARAVRAEARRQAREARQAAAQTKVGASRPPRRPPRPRGGFIRENPF
ncbi:MAG: protein kinase [Deltaproteobacteria bacterium]|nr:protein kinase [Deltaproteobacteria bacterium]